MGKKSQKCTKVSNQQLNSEISYTKLLELNEDQYVQVDKVYFEQLMEEWIENKAKIKDRNIEIIFYKYLRLAYMERIAMPYSDSMSFLMYVSEITKIIKATKLLPYHPVYIQIPRRLKEKYEDDMKRSADIQMAMNEKEISEKMAEKQTTRMKIIKKRKQR